MTNCLFYSMFYVLFLSLSMGSLRFSQINRTFMSIYKGMLEASVLTIDESGEPVVPYYSKEIVQEYVVNYLEKNLKRYTKDYTVNTDFVDENQSQYCTDFCREVKITLKAKINFFYKYEKTQRFLVVTKDQIWKKNYYRLLKIHS